MTPLSKLGCCQAGGQRGAAQPPVPQRVEQLWEQGWLIILRLPTPTGLPGHLTPPLLAASPLWLCPPPPCTFKPCTLQAIAPLWPCPEVACILSHVSSTAHPTGVGVPRAAILPACPGVTCRAHVAHEHPLIQLPWPLHAAPRGGWEVSWGGVFQFPHHWPIPWPVSCLPPTPSHFRGAVITLRAPPWEWGVVRPQTPISLPLLLASVVRGRCRGVACCTT